MQLCKLLCAATKSAGVIKLDVCWSSLLTLVSIMLVMERFDFSFFFVDFYSPQCCQYIPNLFLVGRCYRTKRRWMSFESSSRIHTLHHSGLSKHFTNQFESEAKCDQRYLCRNRSTIWRLWEVVKTRWRFIECHIVRGFIECCWASQGAI